MGGAAQNGQQMLVAASAGAYEETAHGNQSLVGDTLTLGEMGSGVAADDGSGNATLTRYAMKAAGSTVDLSTKAGAPKDAYESGGGNIS
jgi:hypothetical protein